MSAKKVSVTMLQRKNTMEIVAPLNRTIDADMMGKYNKTENDLVSQLLRNDR